MFEEFPKIHRLTRGMVVTEKIDGTNGQIIVFPAHFLTLNKDVADPTENVVAQVDGMFVYAGSRNRLITPEKDNFGFARFVQENAEEIVAKLGEGRHYGEWWGPGIQRGYGLAEKQFSLFNTSRWSEADKAGALPNKIHVVPVLHEGPFNTTTVDMVLEQLALTGSQASPGFMRPEGVVVFHVPSRTLFKKTLDKNDGHKGE